MGNIFHHIYIADLDIILIAISVLLLAWSVLGAAFYKHMRIIGFVLAVIAVGAILYRTVFTRSSSSLKADFIPFSSFVRAQDNPEMFRSMLMNVFLFVPLGLSLPFVFGGGTSKRILLTILIGCLFSMIVESIQYFASLGMAETDDVICNTLGTALGSCAYPLSLLWRKSLKKFKERKTPDE